jgi:hypothetical protein
MITRKQIICEARKWIGTPFHKQASLIGIGCDCVGLIIGVARALGIETLNALVPSDYDQFRERDYFLEMMKLHLRMGSKKEGAIAILGCAEHGWHAGLISHCEQDISKWIHSCMYKQAIVEQRFFEGAHYFDFPNISEY